MHGPRPGRPLPGPAGWQASRGAFLRCIPAGTGKKGLVHPPAPGDTEEKGGLVQAQRHHCKPDTCRPRTSSSEQPKHLPPLPRTRLPHRHEGSCQKKRKKHPTGFRIERREGGGGGGVKSWGLSRCPVRRFALLGREGDRRSPKPEPQAAEVGEVLPEGLQ